MLLFRKVVTKGRGNGTRKEQLRQFKLGHVRSRRLVHGQFALAPQDVLVVEGEPREGGDGFGGGAIVVLVVVAATVGVKVTQEARLGGRVRRGREPKGLVVVVVILDDNGHRLKERRLGLPVPHDHLIAVARLAAPPVLRDKVHRGGTVVVRCVVAHRRQCHVIVQPRQEGVLFGKVVDGEGWEFLLLNTTGIPLRWQNEWVSPSAAACCEDDDKVRCGNSTFWSFAAEVARTGSGSVWKTSASVVVRASM